MKKRDINLKKGVAYGYEIKLPNTTLVLAIAKNGFVMCGYLNIFAADKFGDVAVIVRGVKNVDDLLRAKVEEVSEEAKRMGIKVGMTGKQALEKMM